MIEENNIINDSIKEFIGGEKYYPPIGWIEKKLKIIGNQGDSINNINNQEQFAIAYLGLDNYLNDNEYQQKIDELNGYYGNVRKMITKKLYKDDIDIKKNFMGMVFVFFQNQIMQKIWQGLLIYMDAYIK